MVGSFPPIRVGEPGQDQGSDGRASPKGPEQVHNRLEIGLIRRESVTSDRTGGYEGSELERKIQHGIRRECAL